MIGLIVAPRDEASQRAACFVADRVSAAGRFVLGVATGGTPRTLYRTLAAAGPDLFRQVDLVALDEYVGLAPGHPRSYRTELERVVCQPLGIPPARLHVPDGSAADPERAADDYERLIAELGGVDLQLLGIGANGHIGFNEPGSALDSRTRVVDLTEATRADNARFFPSPADVPRQAVTQGVGTILDARELVLLAFGGGKAEAVARAVEGAIDRDVPASAIRLHDRVTVFTDHEAAAALRAA